MSLLVRAWFVLILLLLATSPSLAQSNFYQGRSSAPTGVAAGDLCGTYPAPTVCKIGGSPFGTGVAAALANPINALAGLVVNANGSVAFGGSFTTNGNLTFSDLSAPNTLLYTTAARTIGALATANNGVLVTSASGVPSISTTLPGGLSIPNLSITNTTSSPLLTVTATDLSPPGFQPVDETIVDCLGANNTTGCSGHYIHIGDDASVVVGTKPKLYGVNIGVFPLLPRNNVPNDDIAGVIVNNASVNGSEATNAYYIGPGAGFANGALQWITGFEVDASASSGFALGGGGLTPSATFNYGFDAYLSAGNVPTINNAAFRSPNNVAALVGRNAAGSGDIEAIRINGSNQVVIANSGIALFPDGTTNSSTGQSNVITPGYISITGTTSPTFSAGTLGLGGLQTAPTLGAAGEGAIFLNIQNGLSLLGRGGGSGGLYDLTLRGDLGNPSIGLLTGTLNTAFLGNILFSGSSPSISSPNVSVASTAAQNIAITAGNATGTGGTSNGGSVAITAGTSTNGTAGKIALNSSISISCANGVQTDSSGNVSCISSAPFNTAGTGLGSSGSTVSSNAVEHVSYQPGLLTAVNATKAVFHKYSKAATVDNIEGSAATFSCVSNPTITMFECGTSSTCATPTTIGTVTVTAAGTVVDGTLSNPAITAGDYIAFSMTSGTCASVDIAATAQVHSN